MVFAGVSGSGKSSIAFDTVAVESSREWQQSYPLFLRNKMPHYDRPKVDEIRNLTPAIVVDQHAIGANARSTVGTAVDVAPLMRLIFSRVGNPSAGGSMAYSFNHPAGMCPDCTGIGEQLELIEESMFLCPSGGDATIYVGCSVCCKIKVVLPHLLVSTMDSCRLTDNLMEKRGQGTKRTVILSHPLGRTQLCHSDLYHKY